MSFPQSGLGSRKEHGDRGGIHRKIDFSYTRNDVGAGKIDLVWNLSTFGTKNILEFQNGFCCRENDFFTGKSIWCEIFQHSVTKTILEFQNGFCYRENDFLQEKSIWCEIFQHSGHKNILEFQNGFVVPESILLGKTNLPLNPFAGA